MALSVEKVSTAVGLVVGSFVPKNKAVGLSHLDDTAIIVLDPENGGGHIVALSAG